MSEDTAEKLLTNIFDSCGVELNKIPLKTLVAYCEYRRERYTVQKTLIIIMIVLFCLLPVFFISPDFTISEISIEGVPAGTYEISIGNLFPVSSVTASLDGQALRVYEADSRTYYVMPDSDGEMLIKVTLINGQYFVKSLALNGIDKVPPVLESQIRDGNRLYLYLSDEGSGIDWSGIYAKTSDGDRLSPMYWDKEDSYVAFKFPKEDIEIYIPDLKGNILHLAFKVDENEKQ